MLLNKNYYRSLLQKYDASNTKGTDFDDNASLLTFLLISDHIEKNQPLHVNFNSKGTIKPNLPEKVFIELSNRIFRNYGDYPPFNIGDKVKLKFKGNSAASNKIFDVISYEDETYVLEQKSINATKRLKYETLIKDYVPVTQNVKNKTLRKFEDHFKEINTNLNYGFTPTYFVRKSIFIAPRTFYDSLEVTNKIPTTYFPNPREETNPHDIKSIPGLPDSIMYFTTRYNVCYEKILLQNKKIDTICIYNTEENEIDQIVQDKNRMNLDFNVIIITNFSEAIRFHQIPCWNWYKEEIAIVNSL